ncbi:glycerophosphodiester phosphodiesterase [Bizionia sediminis]|uniref:Glycerophosphodiester phosphodiesterase n=1 Tax=Bizionia sediminis TaxID=1737064 RepID=A0ABW5KS60_9FLAO
MTNKQTLIFGHRGAKGYAAENTLESISKALSLGVDGVEIDVHVCASGELVVCHDTTVNRTTNGTGTVASHSFKALKKLTVTGGYKIPSLNEVLELINNTCMLNIELKGANTALKTCQILAAHVANGGWDYTNFLVSSFNYNALETVYNNNKNIALAVLTDTCLNHAMMEARRLQSNIIHPYHTLLTAKNTALAQQNGFLINTWTVNNLETSLRLKQYGVNGIISDLPDKI